MAVSTYHFLFNRSDDSYNNHSPHPCEFIDNQLKDLGVYYIGPIEIDIDQFPDITHVKWDIVNEEIYSYYDSFEGPAQPLLPEDFANTEAVVAMKNAFVQLINDPGDSANSEFLTTPEFTLLLNNMKTYLGDTWVNRVIEDGQIDPTEDALLDKRIQLMVQTQNASVENINSANT